MKLCQRQIYNCAVLSQISIVYVQLFTLQQGWKAASFVMRDVRIWHAAILCGYDAPGIAGFMSKEAVMKSAYPIKQLVCSMPGVLVWA